MIKTLPHEYIAKRLAESDAPTREEELQYAREHGLSPHEVIVRSIELAGGVEAVSSNPLRAEVVQRWLSGEFDYVIAGMLGYV
jgi:hypothetical protein